MSAGAPQEDVAVVREALSYPRSSFAHTGQYLGQKNTPEKLRTQAIAALARLEQRFARLEKALTNIAAMPGPGFAGTGASGWLLTLHAPEIAAEALAAAEPEEKL